jgi:hypothetical protein
MGRWPARKKAVAAPNKRKLSPTFIDKSLKPRDVPYLVWDETQRGLAVCIETTGYAAYKVIYRFGGRPRWYRVYRKLSSGVAVVKSAKDGV